MAEQAAGWLSDPYGRFQQRYWDGTAWTGHVATNGVQQVDPMGNSSVIPFAIPATAFETPATPPPLPADAPDAPDAPAAPSATQALLESLTDEERYDAAVWADEPGADS